MTVVAAPGRRHPAPLGLEPPRLWPSAAGRRDSSDRGGGARRPVRHPLGRLDHPRADHRPDRLARRVAAARVPGRRLGGGADPQSAGAGLGTREDRGRGRADALDQAGHRASLHRGPATAAPRTSGARIPRGSLLDAPPIRSGSRCCGRWPTRRRDRLHGTTVTVSSRNSPSEDGGRRARVRGCCAGQISSRTMPRAPIRPSPAGTGDLLDPSSGDRNLPKRRSAPQK